jgi:hypothetical protein
MIILKELGTDQTWTYIPRTLASDSYVITSETDGTSTTYSYTSTVSGYYLSITDTIALQENNYYTFTALNGSDEVYRGRIFCTNQTVSDYSVNNGEYTTEASNNDYVIYE